MKNHTRLSTATGRENPENAEAPVSTRLFVFAAAPRGMQWGMDF